MTDEEKQEHRKHGKALNNLVWQLLQKEGRSEDENETMVHAAHGSTYHWGLAGTAENLARGEWLVSHVYSVLERPGPAVHHAKRCMRICEEHAIGDFDVAYAYEAMARSLAANGQKADGARYLRMAREAGARIEQEEDRDLFFQDLKAGPWFGVE